ncbi:MAG: hypothetical protein IJ455_09230 [Agathobacter sp.]|nr:hypothetical protein [Agathobacter sp.]
MVDKKILKIAICTIVMLCLMLLAGNTYMYNNGLSGKYANTQAKEGQIKVACIGDSITYGHGISGWKENNYPAVLQELLGEEYHVANFGSSGACVNPEGDQPYADREVYQAALEYDADIIVFMMGTNDSKPENWTDIDSFMEDYMELLLAFVEGEDLPQVYVGICAEAFYAEDCDEETGIAKYDIQPGIVDEIAERLEQLPTSSVYPFSVIDVHSLTEAHPEWFEADGIHPNNDGAKAIAEMVAEAMR